jgi:hypothetical protein
MARLRRTTFVSTAVRRAIGSVTAPRKSKAGVQTRRATAIQTTRATALGRKFLLEMARLKPRP